MVNAARWITRVRRIDLKPVLPICRLFAIASLDALRGVPRNRRGSRKQRAPVRDRNVTTSPTRIGDLKKKKKIVTVYLDTQVKHLLIGLYWDLTRELYQGRNTKGAFHVDINW